MADGAIRDRVCDFFLQEPVLCNYSIQAMAKGAGNGGNRRLVFIPREQGGQQH
jgi:hypothetical protein